MKSLLQAETRKEFYQRLEQLKADRHPKWGRMNCEQMLAHLSDSLRMALGELAVKPKPSPLKYFPLKQLTIYWLPWPKGVPTAPELIARQADNWQKELVTIQELLDRFGKAENRKDWPEHPAFGKLSAQDWGVLQYRHLDHHFRQFGI